MGFPPDCPGEGRDAEKSRPCRLGRTSSFGGYIARCLIPLRLSPLFHILFVSPQHLQDGALFTMMEPEIPILYSRQCQLCDPQPMVNCPLSQEGILLWMHWIEQMRAVGRMISIFDSEIGREESWHVKAADRHTAGQTLVPVTHRSKINKKPMKGTLSPRMALQAAPTSIAILLPLCPVGLACVPCHCLIQVFQRLRVQTIPPNSNN